MCLLNVTNLQLYQLCLTETFVKTLESNYFGGNIFGKTFEVEVYLQMSLL